MANRKVSIIHSTTDSSSRPISFIDALQCPNIILLGDPGAGKSHLLKSSCIQERGEFFTARNFRVASKSLESGQTIYIDGLDEKRSRGENIDLIEELVLQIIELSPSKIRLSCRSADWLGETDLELFRPYFNSHGGFQVLALEPLSEDEIDSLLTDMGISNPRNFRQEAVNKGVDHLLLNPQNLILLVRSVADGNWPNSRYDLFLNATNTLVREENTTHAAKTLTKFSDHDLLDAASSCCAAILIADKEGVSIDKQSEDNPFYKDVQADHVTLLEALSRRIFEQRTYGCFSPIHRTVAEFLAALGLKTLLESEHSLNRILALLSVEGKPTSELRGLFAWLASITPNYADILIPMDPFGILMYGDPSNLLPRQRQLLLDALTELSSLDPWFRSDDWDKEPLGALSGEEMVDQFSSIISDNFPYHLKSLTLEAIARGPQLPVLAPRLQACFEDSGVDSILRFEALVAMIHCDPQLAKRAVEYIRTSDHSQCPVSLKLLTVRDFYKYGFLPHDVVSLMTDILASDQEGSFGTLWYLPKVLPLKDKIEVLDKLTVIQHDIKTQSRNHIDVEHFESDLLESVLRDNPGIDPKKVWPWLKSLQEASAYSGKSLKKTLAAWLVSNPDHLLTILNLAFDEMVDDNYWWTWHIFNEAVLSNFDTPTLVGDFLASLGTKSKLSHLEIHMFELFIQIIAHQFYGDRKLFEDMYEFGVIKGLGANLSRACFCTIDEWRKEQRARKNADELETKASRENILSSFEKEKDVIRQGQHPNFLNFIAKLYFALFNDVKKESSPKQRLSAFLGTENTSIAIEGLIAYLQITNLPTLSEICEQHAQNKASYIWYTVLAAMEESFSRFRNVDFLSAENASAVLAISYVQSVFEHHDNTEHEIDFAWQAALALEHPGINSKVLLALIESGLNVGASVREQVVLLKETTADPLPLLLNLLRKHPSMEEGTLRTILSTIYSSEDYHAELTDLCDQVLSAGTTKKGKRALWYAMSFILQPAKARSAFRRYAKTYEGLIWSIKSLLSSIRAIDGEFQFDAYQLTTLIEILGKIHQKCEHPSGSWSGETNPWDAAEIVKGLLIELSTRTDSTSIASMVKLRQMSTLASYRDDIKHLQSNQFKIYLQGKFVQASWKQTLSALNGQAPANISDLWAMIIDSLVDLNDQLQATNTDRYKEFWNEGSYTRVTKPKNEESSRDRIIDLMRPSFEKLGFSVEPEGHMKGDKRVDIIVENSALKLPIEIKRDYHADIWKAWDEQLDHLYTTDIKTAGFGIYLVLWFGPTRPRSIPKPPQGTSQPSSCKQLEESLNQLIPIEDRHRLKCIVINCSPPK